MKGFPVIALILPLPGLADITCPEQASACMQEFTSLFCKSSHYKEIRQQQSHGGLTIEMAMSILGINAPDVKLDPFEKSLSISTQAAIRCTELQENAFALAKYLINNGAYSLAVSQSISIALTEALLAKQSLEERNPPFFPCVISTERDAQKLTRQLEHLHHMIWQLTYQSRHRMLSNRLLQSEAPTVDRKAFAFTTRDLMSSAMARQILMLSPEMHDAQQCSGLARARYNALAANVSALLSFYHHTIPPSLDELIIELILIIAHATHLLTPITIPAATKTEPLPPHQLTPLTPIFDFAPKR